MTSIPESDTTPQRGQRFLTPSRERFLAGIAEQVPAATISEIHFFPVTIHAGVESGVAVVAAAPVEADAPVEVSVDGNADADVELESTGAAPQPQPSATPPARHIVYTARYRAVLKGPDRGKWDVNVVAEADAPLVTVESVVRGVQRRAGDMDEPERMSGDDARAALARLAR